MAPRKNMKKRGARRPARKYKKNTTANVRDVASSSERRTIVNANAGQMYSYVDFNLGTFPRAINIARSYQQYRITGIKITLKPTFDSYSSTLANGAQKPFLYYMIDKTGSIPNNATLEALKVAGARPRALDEKPISFMWKPSVLTTDATAVGDFPSQYKISPWLSTSRSPGAPGVWSPSITSHLGVKWYVDQGNNQGLQFSVDCELQFEFRKPLYGDAIASAQPAKGLEFAKLDASPDGVEGGNDGITIPLT